MLVPNRHGSSTAYRYGFNGKEKDDELMGQGNSIAFEERFYDSRIGRFFTIDPIAKNYPFQSPYVFAANSPIVLIDVLGMGPGDPTTYTVKKGDNLTKISKKFGVSTDDLKSMNYSIKSIHKIKIGQVLRVNPEADFNRNPRGEYTNPEMSFGKEISLPHISLVGLAFVYGTGPQNAIIVSGEGLKSIQNWKAVDNFVNSSIAELKKDNKYVPGEVAYREFRPGDLPTNIKKGLNEGWEKIKNLEDPWKDNSQNSPIHVIGSFNMSVRVNSNGTTATVCIYDSKTFKSFSDGNANENKNRTRNTSTLPFLTNTYQRYIWNIDLPKK
jgi:RHS repeat-associated protein